MWFALSCCQQDNSLVWLLFNGERWLELTDTCYEKSPKILTDCVSHTHRDHVNGGTLNVHDCELLCTAAKQFCLENTTSSSR